MKRARDLEETTAARDAQKQLYDGLRKERLDKFMAGFSSISLKLKEMYQVRAVILLFINQNYLHLPLDDHSWRQCRAGTCRQYGSLLRGDHLQRDAPEEELEEYLKSIRG